MEVFGRRPDHDLTRDSIVRTEASRLRARLREYYTGEGKDDPLIIELPKGGYVPVLRQSVAAAETPNHEQKGHPRLWLTLAVTGFLAVLGVAIWWEAQRSTPPIGIAVLPFRNPEPVIPPLMHLLADGLAR